MGLSSIFDKFYIIDLKECFTGKEREFLELQAKADQFDLVLHQILKFLREQEELNVDLVEVKNLYSHYLALIVEILIEINRLMKR